MPVSLEIAGSRIDTADVLALTTRADTQVAMRVPVALPLVEVPAMDVNLGGHGPGLWHFARFTGYPGRVRSSAVYRWEGGICVNRLVRLSPTYREVMPW